MHYQRLATAIIIAACLGTSACQKAADSEGGSASSQASPKTIKAFQDHVAKFSMTLFRAEADGVFNGKTGLTDLQPLVDGVYFSGGVPLPVPSGIQTAPAPWQYLRSEFSVVIAGPQGEELGSAAADDLLLLTNIRPEVCDALNADLGQDKGSTGHLEKKRISAANGSKIEQNEGCVATPDGFAYFVVTNRH